MISGGPSHEAPRPPTDGFFAGAENELWLCRVAPVLGLAYLFLTRFGQALGTGRQAGAVAGAGGGGPEQPRERVGEMS